MSLRARHSQCVFALGELYTTSFRATVAIAIGTNAPTISSISSVATTAGYALPGRTRITFPTAFAAVHAVDSSCGENARAATPPARFKIPRHVITCAGGVVQG